MVDLNLIRPDGWKERLQQDLDFQASFEELDATDAHGALNEDEPRGNSSAPAAERVKLMTVHASKAR